MAKSVNNRLEKVYFCSLIASLLFSNTANFMLWAGSFWSFSGSFLGTPHKKSVSAPG